MLLSVLLKKVAFTTSIPVEVIFAAGMIPVDLNNVFITGENLRRPSNVLRA
jgi:hypothetical protein